MAELRGAGCSGGNWTSTGALVVPRGASQSIAFRLTKNDTATTAIASRIVLRLSARRIVPPDLIQLPEPTGRADGAPEWRQCGLIERIRDVTGQSRNPFGVISDQKQKWRGLPRH